MVKHVNNAEFQKAVKESLRLGRCPRCKIGCGGNIVISMPWYGAEGVFAVCSACGYKSGRYSIRLGIKNDESGAIGSPTTIETISRAVESVIKEWNGEEEPDGSTT